MTGTGASSGHAGGGLVLALETSCDDTSAAVLRADGEVLSSVVHSQDEVHARYGGVVPEVASRAHVERTTPVLREALAQAGVGLADIGRVAVTVGPGLVGALLVGVQTAKTIAWARRLPLSPVNHLHGHIASAWVTRPDMPFPAIVLIASGGHTSLVKVEGHGRFNLLGETLDDAAGEAFDKGARLLGLGYPGGRELDELADHGDPGAFGFPVALKEAGNVDFSFSGVKTALYYLLRGMSSGERASRAADVAASYREAIVEALVAKLLRAAESEGAASIGVAGGVAANSLLRRRLGAQDSFTAVIPPLAYCTDNAVMIGAAARFGPQLHFPEYRALEAYPGLALSEWGIPH